MSVQTHRTHGVCASAGRRLVALAKAILLPTPDRGASPEPPMANGYLRRLSGGENVRSISVAFVDFVSLWCDHQAMSRYSGRRRVAIKTS